MTHQLTGRAESRVLGAESLEQAGFVRLFLRGVAEVLFPEGIEGEGGLVLVGKEGVDDGIFMLDASAPGDQRGEGLRTLLGRHSPVKTY